MKVNPAQRFFLSALVILLGAVTGCSSSGRHKGVFAIDRAENLTVERVKELLHESPHEYLAAVQEVVDDSLCYGPKDGSSCPLMVKVVDFIAGEPGRTADRQLGWLYPTMEMRMEKAWPNRQIGRRRLVLAFPVKAGPGWYGNRVFILDPKPEDVEHFREVMRTIADNPGGRLSNTRLKLSVHPVTGRACARPAPGCPAA